MMVSTSTVVLIALSAASVSILGALVAVTVGLSVDIGLFKSNNDQQQKAMESSLQLKLQELLQSISMVNASVLSGGSSAVAVSGGSTITQLDSSLMELNRLLQEEQSRIDRLNASTSEQFNITEAQLQEISIVLGSLGSRAFPAASCSSLLSVLPSGMYWVRSSSGAAIQVYCDMTRTCGNVTGGWARIINLDFNSSDACPTNFVNRTSSNLLTCERGSGTGCTEVGTYSTMGLSYSEVCGRMIVYQYGTPEAFSRSIVISSLTIDSQYLDGLSLTHGSSPRQHIWSFPVGVTITRNDRFACPCNVGYTRTFPAFIGNSFFCDSSATSIIPTMFYPNNPLFDGVGCDPITTTCCSFNSPPWFYRLLSQFTSDNLELRSCQDEPVSAEGIAIQNIDLYVR